MARHSDLLAKRSHEAAFHSATDPSLDSDNRVTAGKFWVDITTPSTPILNIRNEANSAWVQVASTSTFTDTTFAINDNSDATKQIKFDAAGTTGTSTTIQGSQTTNKTLTLPDVTSTVLARTSTDQGANRVQNKDLDASNTKIVDASDTSKKIAFTASGNTTAVTGTIAAAFTTAKTVTLPDATDTLVAKATTDTLTNKTIDSSTNTVSTNKVSLWKQTTYQATTVGDGTEQLALKMISGTSTIPATTTQTITFKFGSTTASHIYAVWITPKGNWPIYLEDAAGNVLPKTGSTLTINNNDSSSHDVNIVALID